MTTRHPLPSKAELRKKALALREATNALGNLARMEQAMATRLSLWPPFRRARRILAYAPFRGEINLLSLLAENQGSDVAWYLPVTQLDNGLSFYRHRMGETLIEGRYGILQPIPSEDRIDTLANGDLILVPGLAFDHSGRRLGYGKGYYDRFLTKMSSTPAPEFITLGVAPEILVWEELPADSWDIPVQAILTEKGITDLA